MSANVLSGEKISGEIVDIIKSSLKYCLIVSPYYQPWPRFEKILDLCAVDEKKIAFFFRDDQYGNSDIHYLNNHYNFDVFFVKNLHAKIYLNEKRALVSSMNLFNYSKENNFEIAYNITTNKEINELASDIILGEMIKIWVSNSLPGRYYIEIGSGEFLSSNKSKANISTKNNAFCIRCGFKIPYDFNGPFCFEDYQE